MGANGGPAAGAGWRVSISGGLAGAAGTVAGIVPHLLHHAGPILGAALLTGALGTTLFGVIGFALTVPLLLQLRRRFHSRLVPAIALGLFGLMFTVSTLWIGPAIRGGDSSTSTPDAHHTSARQMMPAPRCTELGEGRCTARSSARLDHSSDT
jgi:hypothetical protein